MNMSNIKFVSHEKFPEDPYTKELVYLLIDDKYRVAYIRKAAKNGGSFWGPISASITKNGNKEFYQSFLSDSAFLNEDIKNYLNKRAWEKENKRPTFQDDEAPF